MFHVVSKQKKMTHKIYEYDQNDISGIILNYRKFPFMHATELPSQKDRH